MLLVAAVLSLGMGAFVARFGQERRVKLWFFLTCLNSSALATGLWVEVHIPAWAFFAARVNMTAALITAGTGVISARIMCGLKTHRPVIVLLTVSAILIIATVWVTDVYFTGQFIYYAWGLYVGGQRKFVINPLLVTVIALYALYALAVNYRQAHPLDKNRTKYLFAAYAFLSLSLLDYLPHFGIDLFGGPVSALSIPLFVGTFGYASLQYRLVEFHSFLGRASGYLLTAFLMVAGYVFFLDASARWLRLPPSSGHVGAALFMIGILLGFGKLLPNWARQAISRDQTDFQRVLKQFSDDVMSIVEEPLLHERIQTICCGAFGSSSVDFLSSEVLSADMDAVHALRSASILDTEVYRRLNGVIPASISEAELVVPLVKQNELIGALTVGKKSDGNMYGESALDAFRTLGNLLTMAVCHARSALELEKRHHLDRYLAPQIVERVLSGERSLLEERRRMMVTIFFSDLKGFTEMADRLAADKLSTVLNEYLSEMADLAFKFGGTVDKFIGDAVMVFFGAPVESAAASQVEQCVNMAIAMQQNTLLLNESWRKRGLLDHGLISRMGIHTGEATVGAFGSHSRIEYTAIGRAVNLAWRLEGKCTPGKLLLSQEAWALVQGKFSSEPRGFIQVKGFADPVEVSEITPPTVSPRTSMR